MTTAENDNAKGIGDDFDFYSTEWDDLPGDQPMPVAVDLLRWMMAEDPFATSRLEDCVPELGISPSALARYERASAAFIAACHSEEQDDDQQEILRLIAAYWLKKSRAFWID
jgi:hypothetical protein